MTNLKMEPVWTFTASQTEMRLILQALGGRLHSSDIETADKLCDKLTQMRIHEVREMAKLVDGIETKMKALR